MCRRATTTTRTFLSDRAAAICDAGIARFAVGATAVVAAYGAKGHATVFADISTAVRAICPLVEVTMIARFGGDVCGEQQSEEAAETHGGVVWQRVRASEIRSRCKHRMQG